jgi:hypothetical protein
MLPDLRIVIAAVISTFVLTVGVGFYASTRMIQEPKMRSDLLATLEETPVNRIALSWPEPMQQSEALALDFAVTARALRNPVRDVTNEPAPVEPQQPLPVRTAATDLAGPAPAEKPVQNPPAKSEAAPLAATIATPAPSEKLEPAPEPDIRVAVQYPPILELPPELQAAPASAVPSPPVAAEATDAPSTTGSVAEPPKDVDADDADAARSPGNPAQPVIAVRPDPTAADSEDDQEAEQVPKPAPKAKAKKAAPKKAAPKKAAPKKAAPPRAAKRPARRTAPRLTNAVPNFFNFFTLQR